jgi:hypothetical protein
MALDRGRMMINPLSNRIGYEKPNMHPQFHARSPAPFRNSVPFQANIEHHWRTLQGGLALEAIPGRLPG